MSVWDDMAENITTAKMRASLTGKPVVTAVQLDDKFARLPLPIAEPDLSNLGASDVGWHSWSYHGPEYALVRRIDSIDPDRPRPMSYVSQVKIDTGQEVGVPVKHGPHTDLEWRQRFVGVIPRMWTHVVIWGFIVDVLEGHEDGWCYHTALEAIAAGTAWSGAPGTEPEGWHRHPASGRRRRSEFVLEPGNIELGRTDTYLEYMLDTDLP